MIFDEKTIRLFSKKYKTKNITIYPYYEIKIKALGKIVNTKLSLIALLIEYSDKQEKEYYLQFLSEENKKYKNEILKKFTKN